MRKSLENAVGKKAGLTGVRGQGTSLFIDAKDEDTAY